MLTYFVSPFISIGEGNESSFALCPTSSNRSPTRPSPHLEERRTAIWKVEAPSSALTVVGRRFVPFFCFFESDRRNPLKFLSDAPSYVTVAAADAVALLPAVVFSLLETATCSSSFSGIFGAQADKKKPQ